MASSSQPMRVIFINRVYWPSEEATAQLLTDLVDGLAATGLTCEVITGSSGPGCREVASGQTIKIHRTQPQPLPRQLGLVSKAWGYRQFASQAQKTLQQHITSHDQLVVMTDPPLLAPKLRSIAQRTGAPMWHWAQDIYPEVAIALTRNRILRTALRLYLRGRDQAWKESAGIVTIGSDMARLIRNRVGQTPPVTIVPNWAPKRADQEAKHDFRTAWGLSSADLIVMYSGNLGRAHTLEPLLELAQHCRENAQIHFVIVGDGPQKTRMVSLAEQKQLPRLSFHPKVPREHLASLLSAADVHVVTMRPACNGMVLPSKFYGIVEAHRPLIYLGHPTSEYARSIAKHGLGVAAAPTDVPLAAAWLERLAGDANLKHQLADNMAKYSQKLAGLSGAIEVWRSLLATKPQEQNAISA